MARSTASRRASSSSSSSPSRSSSTASAARISALIRRASLRSLRLCAVARNPREHLRRLDAERLTRLDDLARRLLARHAVHRYQQRRSVARPCVRSRSSPPASTSEVFRATRRRPGGGAGAGRAPRQRRALRVHTIAQPRAQRLRDLGAWFADHRVSKRAAPALLLISRLWSRSMSPTTSNSYSMPSLDGRHANLAWRLLPRSARLQHRTGLGAHRHHDVAGIREDGVHERVAAALRRATLRSCCHASACRVVDHLQRAAAPVPCVRERVNHEAVVTLARRVLDGVDVLAREWWSRSRASNAVTSSAYFDALARLCR